MKPNKKTGIDKTFEQGIKGMLTPFKARTFTVVLNKKKPTYPAISRGDKQPIGISVEGFNHIEIHSLSNTGNIFGIQATLTSNNEGKVLWIPDGADETIHIKIKTEEVAIDDIVFLLPEQSVDSELSMDVVFDNKGVPKEHNYYSIP